MIKHKKAQIYDNLKLMNTNGSTNLAVGWKMKGADERERERVRVGCDTTLKEIESHWPSSTLSTSPLSLPLNPSPTSSALIWQSCSPRTTLSLTIAKSAVDFNFLSAPPAAHPSTASVHPKVCTTTCEGQVYLSLPPGVAAPDVQVTTLPYNWIFACIHIISFFFF